MTQMQERADAVHAHEASPGDDAGTPAPCEPCFLLASAAASAQSFALLAVPSHAQAAPPVKPESGDSERGDGERGDKASDPISEAGWLAAADALLMGGLLNDG